MRLIDADALKEAMNEHTDYKGYLVCDPEEIIDLAPTVERPHGEWIKRFDGNEWYWYCTSCKTQWYEEDLYMGGNEFPNYCPNCGADMREEGEAE